MSRGERDELLIPPFFYFINLSNVRGNPTSSEQTCLRTLKFYDRTRKKKRTANASAKIKEVFFSDRTIQRKKTPHLFLPDRTPTAPELTRKKKPSVNNSTDNKKGSRNEEGKLESAKLIYINNTKSINFT